jgi:hypothetical protein
VKLSADRIVSLSVLFVGSRVTWDEIVPARLD